MYRSIFFLTSALVGGEWPASRYGGSTPGTHWIGGRVDTRAGLDKVTKRKFLALQGLNSDPSVMQSVGSRCADCAKPASNHSAVIR
jgi:hypothetical protein